MNFRVVGLVYNFIDGVCFFYIIFGIVVDCFIDFCYFD